MSDFVTAVARKASVESAKAEEILARHGVRESSILPRPRKLLIKRVAFTGEKSGKSAGRVDFAWDLGPGLWGVTADNLRGKSSVLEIIWWCLRGISPLQADVQHWVHTVRLDGEIDGETFTVRVDNTKDQLEGTLAIGVQRHVTSFADKNDFASVMGSFMMDRLGLEHLRSWHKHAPVNTDAEIDSNDGQVVMTSWPAFSHALLCRNRESDPLLGATAQGGTLVSLLQMFVGLPWATTRRDAKAALALTRQAVRGKRRRAEQDTAARSSSVADLEEQLAWARQTAAQASSVLSLEAAAHTVEQAGAHLADLTSQHVDAVERERQTRQAEAEIHESLVLDQARLRDLRETEVAQRFFGALKPTCCPRCSTALAQLPHNDLDETHCHICGSTPTEEQVDSSTTSELADSIKTLEVAHSQAKSATEQAARVVTTLKQTLAQARADLATAQAAIPRESALRAHLDVARLEGQLAERRAAEEHTRHPEEKSEEETVLNAAVREADKRAKAASAALLGSVSEEICRLAIRLGIKELQAVRLLGNGTLEVTKGNRSTTFTSLSPGEHVRLRIATLLALLRIGNRTGTGRHPGLILLDSAGAQESINTDVAEVLSQLNDICAETDGLQLITATANRDLAIAAIPAHRLRVASPGEPVW